VHRALAVMKKTACPVNVDLTDWQTRTLAGNTTRVHVSYAMWSIELQKQKEDRQTVITTDTTNELGTRVAKDFRTVMQGKVAIAGEASCEEALARYLINKQGAK